MAQQSWLNQLGIVATVQNFKKKKKEDKVAQQNGTVDVQSAKTLDVECKNTVRAFALLYIRKKSTNLWLKKKKKYILNKPKVLYLLHIHLTSVTMFSQNIYF